MATVEWIQQKRKDKDPADDILSASIWWIACFAKDCKTTALDLRETTASWTYKEPAGASIWWIACFAKDCKTTALDLRETTASWTYKEPAAVGSDSTSRRKQQLIQSRATVDQLLICIQSQRSRRNDNFSISAKKSEVWTVAKKK
ncbi:hypothetical protein F511_44039 [Dorcoceras hygrometricum]|uniref:Uncharacterized protein n=1 Tax=Dorcoceras hygrometricum TaxID=472368 RepID=A0A2Z7BI07_9LAMI|nr:hypothetical protein F511_44039 [Dorcoceras hygrometricum]